MNFDYHLIQELRHEEEKEALNEKIFALENEVKKIPKIEEQLSAIVKNLGSNCLAYPQTPTPTPTKKIKVEVKLF